MAGSEKSDATKRLEAWTERTNAWAKAKRAKNREEWRVHGKWVGLVVALAIGTVIAAYIGLSLEYANQVHGLVP